MSEEQREILQMVSDGKISADDGAKLLEALKVGEQKRREMKSPAGRAREKRRIILETKGMTPFAGLSSMRQMGRMMRSVMKDAIPGTDEDEYSDIDEDMYDDAGLLESPLEVEEGTVLVLKRRVHRNSGGDLVLKGISGSTLEVLSEDTPDIRMYRDNGTILLRWSKGDLELGVPETVEKVRASILGGDIILNGLSAVADIRTKGGDINLHEASKGFRAKTMGGDILITLNDRWNEDSRAASMGGNITLSINESTKACISAKTFGGEISIQGDIEEVTESGHAGASRVNIDLSVGEESSDLSLKTMGGDITVTMSGTQPAREKNAKKKRSGKKKK